jgi:NADH:ubiquinone oxidoreductase subunit E
MSTHHYREYTPEAIDEVLAPYQGRKGVVMQSLHALQHAFGYISPDAVRALSKILGISPSLVYGTMTYYFDFRTTPPPAHEVWICLGPSCIAKGARKLERATEAYLGVPLNQETADGQIGFRQEQCYGICDLSPYLRVDGQVCGNLETRDLPRVLEPVTGLPVPEAQREPSYTRQRVV